MTIKDRTLQQVGTALKRSATMGKNPVDDDFILELKTYATNPVVRSLDEPDVKAIIERIGQETLKVHRRLDVGSIRATINDFCNPDGSYDLCFNAARKILSAGKRWESVKKLDSSAAALRNRLKLNE
jgi:hypothetical protein